MTDEYTQYLQHEPQYKAVDLSTFESIKDGFSNTLFAGNRARFVGLMRKELQVNKDDSNPIIGLFKGSNEVPLYSSDMAYPDYQNAFFYYLFGVFENDCYGLIDFSKQTCTLFVQRQDNLLKIWGSTMTREDFAQKYGVEVQYIDSHLAETLREYQSKGAHLYINSGVNSDSGRKTCIPEAKYTSEIFQNINSTLMHDVLCESRVIKTEGEIGAMRWASAITAEAHKNVLRNVKPGQREAQIESFFNHHGQQNFFTGRVAPYLSICGCGPGAATLHYNSNNQHLKDGQMMLTDQGHSIHHYCSDVTISFPVNGKFTQKQKEIYEIVLCAAKTVFAHTKPGVNWLDMHRLAERVLLTGLKRLGLVTGDVDTMVENRTAFLFMPHGLGHFIGLDTHDVGGYTRYGQARSTLPGWSNLRTARILKENMVVTIEPGCYFRDFLVCGEVPKEFFDFDLSNLNLAKIKEYQAECQGLRIEDVVLITKDGCENLSYDIPRQANEVEAYMAGNTTNWKGC